jgi:hypothetical protein
LQDWPKEGRVNKAAVSNPANDSPDDTTYSMSTIEEQVELGYQSDSSETEFLIPRNRDSTDTGTAGAPTLPTLHEDPNEKDHQTQN